MSQNWKGMTYSGSNVAVSDLTDIETNFAVLKSSFLGTSAPSATEAGQLWFDSTDKVMKVRNAADTDWQGLMYGNTDTKIWVYLNAAPDGWLIDSGVTDVIMALEGGTTYTTADTEQGSWTMEGLTSSSDSHTHQWYFFHEYTSPSWGWGLYGGSWNSAGTAVYYIDEPWQSLEWGYIIRAYYTGRTRDVYNPDLHVEGASHNHTGATYTSAWRPAAAVGVLMYPNI